MNILCITWNNLRQMFSFLTRKHPIQNRPFPIESPNRCNLLIQLPTRNKADVYIIYVTTIKSFHRVDTSFCLMTTNMIFVH